MPGLALEIVPLPKSFELNVNGFTQSARKLKRQHSPHCSGLKVASRTVGSRKSETTREIEPPGTRPRFSPTLVLPLNQSIFLIKKLI